MSENVSGFHSARIHHGEGEETVGMGVHGGGYGFMIAGKAGDQRGTIDAVTIQLTRPHFSQFFGLGGRKLPFELRLHGFERQVQAFARQEARRSGARKNVRGRRPPAADPKGTAGLCADQLCVDQ